MNTYDLGDVVTLEFTTYIDGDAADADAVTLAIVDPAGETTTVDPVTSSGTGSYLYEFTPVLAGRHVATWVATGDGAAADADVFVVVDTAADLVSVDELSAYLQQSFTAGALMTSAQMACRQATAVVRGFCQNTITRGSRTYTRVVQSGYTEGAVFLPERPVVEVTSVVVDAVTSSDFQLVDWQKVVFTPYAAASIVVNYTAGWAEGEYPLDVARNVALRLAARLYENPLDRGSFSGPEQLSYAPAAGVAARLLTGDERESLSVASGLVLGFG